MLYAAAAKDWSQVEPAIFGTLLERALEKKERSRLGAHYSTFLIHEVQITFAKSVF